MSIQDDSMSSGSRLREFGLYRSMDARTAEFLRLSRKRQLRSGCACAAASTAITVTIVIVVFLVYEFSLNSNTQLEKSLKYNWPSVINDTEDGTSFDPKLTQANIDRTTLKLLPLLLKAIKKNAALEKLFEDQSSYFPRNENERNGKKINLEHSNEQNMHANDWLRKPTTHLFAADYRTLPLIFYRDPTKNIELYTKIRKIRDYQRVFKYVDKMINDKVYVRSTKPMRSEPSYHAAATPRALQPAPAYHAVATPRAAFKHNKRGNNSNKAENKNITSDDMTNTCKCAHHLKQLLSKIIKHFETILPQIKKKFTRAMHSDCQKHSVTSLSPKNSPKNLKSSSIDFTPLPTHWFSERSIQIVAVPPQKANTFLPEDDNFDRDDLQIKESTYATDSKNKLSVNELRYIKKKLNTQSIKQKNLDKFNKITHKTQHSKRQETKLNTKFVPGFNGVKHNDYNYYTLSAINKTPNIVYINHKKTKLNNLKDNYLTNAKSKVFNRIKNNTATELKNTTDIDTKFPDKKITLLEAKQPIKCKKTKVSETKNNKSQQDTSHKNHTDTLNLFESNTLDDEKQIISNLFNSSAVMEKYFNNNLTDLPVLLHDSKNNQYAPKPSYFKYSTDSQEDKTMYETLKNSVYSYICNKSLSSSSTPPVNMINDQEQSKTMQPLNYTNKTNKTSTYRIIENHVNSLLHINISGLKSLKQKYDVVIPTVKTINNNEYENNNQDKIMKSLAVTLSSTESYGNRIITTTPRSDIWTKVHTTSYQSKSDKKLLNAKTERGQKIIIESENRKIFDEGTHSSTIDPNEFITEDSDILITEITKSPENAIHQSTFNLSEKQINSDLTWEDLTNEFMPAWRSMIQDPNKPIYLGFQHDKTEEQEDYNINSNFYDLNL